MQPQFKLTFILSILLTVLIGCSSGDEDNCLPESFTFSDDQLELYAVENGVESKIDGNGYELDLSKEGLRIKVDFGSVIPWKIRIESGDDVKIFSGESAVVDELWYGVQSRDGGNLVFEPGEVWLTIDFECRADVYRFFDIKGTQNFRNLDPSYGFLLRDWDYNGKYPVAGSTFSNIDGWAGHSSGLNSFIADYFSVSPSPAGGSYFQLYGEAVNPMWYMGGHTFSVAAIENHLGNYTADQIYVNCYVRGDYYDNASAQIGIQCNNQTYLTVKGIDWTGWKLLSYKLSDFISPSGEKLNSLDMQNIVFQNGPDEIASTELKVDYDFVLLSFNRPLFFD